MSLADGVHTVSGGSFSAIAQNIGIFLVFAAFLLLLLGNEALRRQRRKESGTGRMEDGR